LYEVLVREAGPQDLQRWGDGALLVDVWPDVIILPREIRDLWRPVLEAELGSPSVASVNDGELGAVS
jgi:hypothetical protein